MKKYLKYIITSAIGLIIAFIIIISKNIFEKETLQDVMHVLTDAFFVPGIIISGFGLLVVCSNGGTFDMLRYGIIKFFSLFKKNFNNEKYKTFYEYRMVKSENPRPFWYLIIVGVSFIIISMIFLVIYYL